MRKKTVSYRNSSLPLIPEAISSPISMSGPRIASGWLMMCALAGTFNGLTIEQVNCITGEIEVIYRARQGAHVGVVTVSPDMPAPLAAFIAGWQCHCLPDER